MACSETRLVWFCLLACLTALGCQPDSGAINDVDGLCIPDRAAFESNALPALNRACGACHGASPEFGANYSFTDYDTLIMGTPGQRPVDRIIARLSEGDMPPAPFPAPSHNDFDTMMLWSSCGLQHPDYQQGLTANAPIFLPPDELPKNTETWEIRANGFHIDENTTNHYQCWASDVPFDAPKLIKRIEVDLDETRVLHHIVLYRDTNLRHEDSFRCAGIPSDTDFLYAWAPGQDAIQFETGGLLAKPGERYIMQIHYNNAAGIADVADDSAIRIYYGEEEGTAYGMFVPGPNIGIMVSPNSQHTVTGVCQIKEEITLLAGMPHMHEAGRGFRSDVIRADGTEINLIELTGWSFEAQLFYEMPITLYPGDELLTTCTYENTSSDRTIFFGDGTEDEMCFNFLYATPVTRERFCNDEHRFP